MGWPGDQRYAKGEQVRRSHVHDRDWPSPDGGRAVINLLPPDLKTQIKYSKLNLMVLNYLRITAVVVVVLAGIFVWAVIDIGRRTADKAAQVAEDQKQVTQLSESFL